ncbi:MAG TPA: signal peptidase II [Streptosporangiaceae bacterium]
MGVNFRSVGLVAVIVVAGAAADLGSKAWAQSRLSRGRDITLGGGLLRLQLTINHGAAFGLGAALEPLLAIVSLVIVVVVGWWAVRASSRGQRVGAALAASGGLGNLVDRVIRPPSVLHGGVVDWLHVSFYEPTFNVADVLLRGGLLLAAVAWLFSRRTAAPVATGDSWSGRPTQ